MPLFAFALLLLQFVHNSPNTPVVTAPVLHYQLPPDLARSYTNRIFTGWFKRGLSRRVVT